MSKYNMIIKLFIDFFFLRKYPSCKLSTRFVRDIKIPRFEFSNVQIRILKYIRTIEFGVAKAPYNK
jgi:hypothetical protein